MREFLEYLQKCSKWAIERYGIVEKLLILTLVIVVVTIGGIYLAISQDEGLWLLLIATLLVVWVILTVFVAPFFVWRSSNRKIKEYETEAIELIIENNDQYIQKRGRNWILRVGVKALGKRSAINVEVTLTERDGHRHAYSDAPLRPAYSLPGEPSSFPVKSGGTKFVEVFSWGEGDKEMRIHYHCNYQIILGWYDETYENDLPPQIRPFLISNGIPIGEKVTLCATGDNIKPTSETFRVFVDGKKPAWEKSQT